MIFKSTKSWFTLFTVILVVISYALAFYIELGSSMKQFRNFRTSFITCLASLFVEIDLIEEIFIHSRYLGPALLITYIFPFGIQFCLAYQAIKQLRIVEALKKKGVHCPELCQLVMNTVFKVKTILKLSQVVVRRKTFESVTKQLDHDIWVLPRLTYWESVVFFRSPERD